MSDSEEVIYSDNQETLRFAQSDHPKVMLEGASATEASRYIVGRLFAFGIRVTGEKAGLPQKTDVFFAMTGERWLLRQVQLK